MMPRMNLKRLIQSVAKNFSAAEEIFSSRKVTEAAEIFYRLRYVLGGIFFLLCVLPLWRREKFYSSARPANFLPAKKFYAAQDWSRRR